MSNNTLGEKIMDQQKIDMYIMENQKYFPAGKILSLRDKLKTLDEETFFSLLTVELKDPTTLFITSLLL